MQLPIRNSEQLPFNIRSEIEKHMLSVMDKSTHEESLSQPIKIIIRRFKIAFVFLTSYSCSFNVTIGNVKVCFLTSINDESFNEITIPSSAFDL